VGSVQCLIDRAAFAMQAAADWYAFTSTANSAARCGALPL
jgi:hypothetical protein